MFTTGSFVKNYYLNLRFFDVLQSTLPKNQKKKNCSQKRRTPPKICIARDRRKILKKVKEKGKMRKKPNKNNDLFFTFTFLYRKSHILLNKHIWKSLVCNVRMLDLYYSFYCMTVIGNAVIKQQRPIRYTLIF